MFPSPVLPFIIGLAMAGWFGFLAYRAGRGLVLWVIGGGCLGLVVSMVCVGLAHAVAVPYSDTQVTSYYLRGAVFAIVLLGLIGAGITWWLSSESRNEKPAAETRLTDPSQGR